MRPYFRATSRLRASGLSLEQLRLNSEEQVICRLGVMNNRLPHLEVETPERQREADSGRDGLENFVIAVRPLSDDFADCLRLSSDGAGGDKPTCAARRRQDEARGFWVVFAMSGSISEQQCSSLDRKGQALPRSYSGLTGLAGASAHPDRLKFGEHISPVAVDR